MRTKVVADYTFLYMRGAHLTQSMSENVKITCAETMSQNFRHLVISTHKNVQIARAETMCTFSLRKKFVKCKKTLEILGHSLSTSNFTFSDIDSEGDMLTHALTHIFIHTYTHTHSHAHRH